MGERFIAAVIRQMPRATRREREDISRELTAHMEDAMEVYTAVGFGDEEAQRRTVEAMGDPDELGKALNAQLSPFWLWLGRCARAVCAIALLGAGYGLLCRLFPSLEGWVRELLWARR